MSYYFDQPRTPSFPIGLVKTESDFIIRSVETGWWRWTLVAAVISVDAYLFLAFSNLTCHLEDTGDESTLRVTKIISRIGVTWTHTLPFRFLPLFDSVEWYDHVNQITLNHNSLKLSFIHVRGIKLPRHCCSMWSKRGWLSWSKRFLC